jgi:hypothetical protein
MADFPVVFTPTEPYLELDNPCARFAVLGEAWVKIDVWFWSESWSWGPLEFVDESSPDGCSPAGWPPTHVMIRRADEHPVIFAAPAVSTNDAGHSLAVWIQDQSEEPSQPDPELVASLWDGYGWNSPLRITTNDRWETDPRVVFLAPDRALAVWTQNELPRDHDEPNLTLDTMLAHQELYYSVWDGVVWSAPTRLTQDETPDGRVSLAADAARGTALAAWVRDEDGLAATRGDWEIYYAAWDGTAWSAPAPISPHPGAELEVEVAFDRAGRAWAVWVRDADGDLNEAMTSDRRVVYSTWDGAAWSEPASPAGWPTGVLYPSIAFDSADNPLLVFTVRGRLPSGALGGIGQDLLHAAYRRDATWQVVPITTQIAAERPRVVIDSRDQATVLFRGLGRPNTRSYVGEMAIAVADLTQTTLVWGPPGFLTQDDVADWQVAFDVDRSSGDLYAFGVKQGSTTVGGRERALDSTANGSLYALSRMALPDLTLSEADIAVSNPYGLSQTINISATVWNRGLAAAEGPFAVRFVQGNQSTGVTIDQVSVLGSLNPNVSATVSITWTEPAGPQELIVLVDAGRSVAEDDEGNNAATKEVGRPPAPRLLAASRAPDSGHVLLTWAPPNMSGVEGYRVYRATQSGGPYALIGLSWQPIFEDWVSPRFRQTDYYVVTSLDNAGGESDHSLEALATPWEGRRCYLPLVAK